MKLSPQRRTGRIIAGTATTAALALLSWGMPATANAAATTGLHTELLECSATAAPTEGGSLDIAYRVTFVAGTYYFRFTEAVWQTTPARALNALRLDLETSDNEWVEVSPTWGGSSATPDDVSSSFHQSPANTSSWPDKTFSFNNTNKPRIRLRCYGLGPGTTASDAAHNSTHPEFIK